MTTFGDLQARIADELGGRADLAAQIQLAIQTAIQKWERERFYFNELRTANAFSTVPGQEFYGASDYAPLATIAHLDKVTVLVTGNRYTLAPRLAQYLEDVSVNPIVQGQPIDYAYYAEQLRLHPIPDSAYPISLLGTTRFPNPEEKAKAQQQMQAALLDAAIKAESEQRDIDKQEAASASVFVAGWRPAVGWLCVVTLAYQWMLAPFLTWCANWAAVALGWTIPQLPHLDSNDTQTLLYALLGIGSLRTVDKITGNDTVAVGLGKVGQAIKAAVGGN